MIRLLYSIPLWIIFATLRALLILLGWVVVPVAVLFGGYESYEGQDGAGNPRTQYRFTWRWMWLWDNWEDGIANDTYWDAPNLPMQIVYWTCLRNPVNNLRIVPYLSLKIEPDRVNWVGTDKPAEEFDRSPAGPEWFFCWHGIYSCIWIQFPMFKSIWRLWLGWKLFPYDEHGVTGHRFFGAGFATQFKRLS